MLPLKTILYLCIYWGALLGGVFYHPIIGLFGYLITYNINPMSYWWFLSIPDWMWRYSFVISIATFLGIVFHRSKLKFQRFWETQEILLVLYLGVIWLSIPLSDGIRDMTYITKMSKVVLIILAASHLVTSLRSFQTMIWLLIISASYMGYEMSSGWGDSVDGRYASGIGGSDFGETNFLAAHFAAILPFIGAILLGGRWQGWIISFVASSLLINGIVICRSRGVFVALAVGSIVTLISAFRLKQYRKKIIILLILGVIGGFSLTDVGFRDRISTIEADKEERDESAKGRLYMWQAAWHMALDRPFGVGAGNFFHFVGYYAPGMEGTDTHNTYLRCLAELGFQGLFVLSALIANALRTLIVVGKKTVGLGEKAGNYYKLWSFALTVSLIVYLVAALFISSTYIEEFYWFLLFPTMLRRAEENETQ